METIIDSYEEGLGIGNMTSQEYLRECLDKIRTFLEKEKLQLNRKTRLFSNKENFTFLGRKKNGRYANYRTIKKKMKYRYYQYMNNKISLNSLVSTIKCYRTIESKVKIHEE